LVRGNFHDDVDHPFNLCCAANRPHLRAFGSKGNTD
jgi:hypothetical protein